MILNIEKTNALLPVTTQVADHGKMLSASKGSCIEVPANELKNNDTNKP